MGIDLLGSKTVRIRKPLRCWGCNQPQKEGTVMHKETQVDDGEFVHFYFCQPCKDWLSTSTGHWDRADWEVLTRGDVGDFRAGEGVEYTPSSTEALAESKTTLTISRQEAGVISVDSIWVALADTGYMYTASTIEDLFRLMAEEWEDDTHLVG